MADHTANGLTLLAATVTMPRIGTWKTEGVVDTIALASLQGTVALVIADVTFKGVPRDISTFEGKTEFRLVGGAGKLYTELDAKYYHDVPLRIPLADILAATGETLSSTADTAILNRQLTKWSRTSGPASAALTRLLDSVGATWRILADGQLWVGTETWPELKPEGEVLDEYPAEAGALLALERAEMRPGVVYAGRRVGYVIHRLTASQFRTEVLYEQTAAPYGRALEALLAIIRKVMAPTLYYGLFGARIVAQNADGSLELEPDDPRIPQMSGVPIHYGIPASTQVPPNTRCKVGFTDGDPAKPYATSFESSSATEVSIAGGTLNAARQGDMVLVGGPTTLIAFGAPAPPPGPPVPLAVGVPYPMFVFGSGPTPLPYLTGTVSSGNPKVKE